MTEVPDEIWAATIATLKAVDLVLAAREWVEACHGTTREAEAMTVLGDRLNDLEDAFDALRSHHETALKDD